jgi:hypothetical protein
MFRYVSTGREDKEIRRNFMKKLIVAMFIGLLISGGAIAAEIDTYGRIAESREVVKAFLAELKGRLVAAIKEGGPTHAIPVCNEQAPLIAANFSAENGWRVARTSLKFRNPGNAPDPWEKKVLESFEARKAAGEDPQEMEYAEVVQQGDALVFRYMKAIPTVAAPCLMCHGEAIAKSLAAKLDEFYPEDQARGYKAGDIRGAFTITQPIK